MNAPAPAPAVRGTQGYAEQAETLIARYESVPAHERHTTILYLLPATPCVALDVGAGSGADAAWLAARGHRVVAVEPTRALREYGMQAHASPAIEWLDDSLPHLERLARRGERFDLVMLTAVWMHLDVAERALAMPALAARLAPGGVLAMTLRHGPVPAGRVMFEVGADEAIALAAAQRLACVHRAEEASRLAANRDAGVTWTRLVFRAALAGS